MTANLLVQLAARADAGRPLRIGLIGAGGYGDAVLGQIRHVGGLQLLGVADPAPQAVRAALLRSGWPERQFAATSLGAALATGATHVGDDAAALIAADGLDVVVEATDAPAAGIAHCLLAIDYGRQIVMANLAADALAGPLLARRAAEAGLVYSLAYGDRPALLTEFVAWARTCGFKPVCAGIGAPFLPAFRQATPEHYAELPGLTPTQLAKAERDPQQLVAALDGSRAAIELAAVANACELVPQPDGLGFPPCGAADLPHVCRPAAHGGSLAHAGTLEVVSSLERDGRPVHRALQRGVFITVAAPDEDLRGRFAEYALPTDASGRYAALYRPNHLLGLELPISLLQVALRGEPTGRPVAWRGDVAAVAKRDLAAGEILDGMGGFTVYGTLLPPAITLARGLLPLGLAGGLLLQRPVPAGQALSWDDVQYEPTNPAVRMRRLMERSFGPQL
jgi:predicted homoserine dehydrogenase-like protein